LEKYNENSYEVLILILTSVTLSYAEESKDIPLKEWITDSYHYGLSGGDCSEIYYNYGIAEWTVSSDDPDTVELLYETCESAREDKLTDHNRLLRILDSHLNKNK
jgi:hypothetical protein